MDSPPAARTENEVGILGWVAAVLGPLILSGVLVAFRSQLGLTNAALLLVLPVLAAALLGGRTGGGVSAVIAALCFDFFFTRPYYSFTINRREDLESTVVLLIVGLVVGELVVRTRRSQRLALASRREINQMLRIAELAAGSGPAGRLITIVEHELIDLLGLRGARFERPPFATSLPQLDHGKLTVPGTDPSDHQPLGPRNEVGLPVWGHGRQIGRLVLTLEKHTTGVALPPADRALAVALADQLGAVLAASNET